MGLLENKVTVITGGTRGFGLAMAQAYLREGAFDTIVRMFGKTPDVPAEKAVWLGSAATDGKTDLLVEQSGRFALLAGALKEGIRRLLRRPAPSLDMDIRTIPSALSCLHQG